MEKVLIIKVDGTERLLEVETTKDLKWVKTLMGLKPEDALDGVDLRNGRYMYVDDIGKDRNKPRNEKATQLYLTVCKPGVTHFIRGDVAIVMHDEEDLKRFRWQGIKIDWL